MSLMPRSRGVKARDWQHLSCHQTSRSHPSTCRQGGAEAGTAYISAKMCTKRQLLTPCIGCRYIRAQHRTPAPATISRAHRAHPTVPPLPARSSPNGLPDIAWTPCTGRPPPALPSSPSFPSPIDPSTRNGPQLSHWGPLYRLVWVLSSHHRQPLHYIHPKQSRPRGKANHCCFTLHYDCHPYRL